MTFDELFDRISPRGKAEIVIERDASGTWYATVDLCHNNEVVVATGSTPAEAIDWLANTLETTE